MKDKHADLLTISEMAHLCRTTKDTLYFYERKGYLKPYFIDDNGYRYYDRNNFYTMDMFLSLREAGSSVEEIGNYLKSPGPEAYLEHMKKKRDDIRRKIHELMTLEGRIAEGIALTQEGLYRKPGEIFIEYMPKQFLLYKFCADHDNPKTSGECFRSVLQAAKDLKVPYDFHLSAFISKERFATANFYPDYYYVSSPIEITGEDVIERPAGKFVSFIHEGKYNDSVIHYPEMIKFIEENNLRIIGNTYEQTLIGWLNSTDDSQYRTKLSIHVE